MYRATAIFLIFLTAIASISNLKKVNTVTQPVEQSASTLGKSSPNQNPFGVMIPSANLPINTRISIAKNLGVVYYRPSAVILDSWNGSCPECEAASQAGLKLILTVRSNGGKQQPTTPPSDLDAYSKKLTTILNTLKPELLVVENEENSQALFYNGTPSQYHQQLKSACKTAHALKIKCTNGGLVSSLVAMMLADHLRSQGKTSEADRVIQLALRDDQLKKLGTTAAQKQINTQVTRGKALIAGYKTAGADFINFHWYIEDPELLEQAVNYLKLQTNLPAITNEIGQQQSESPEWVTNIMTKTKQLNLSLALWFSADINGYGGARALQNTDATFRPNGLAFKSFISTHY